VLKAVYSSGFCDEIVFSVYTGNSIHCPWWGFSYDLIHQSGMLLLGRLSSVEHVTTLCHLVDDILLFKHLLKAH